MLGYWFMLPIAVLFATVAMATGIGGAVMFTPFFLLALDLPAATAVAIGLFIEIFGFGSGIVGFARRALIRYDVATYLLGFTVPGAIIGAFLAHHIPGWTVKAALAVLLAVLAYLLWQPMTRTVLKDGDPGKCDNHSADDCYEQPTHRQGIRALSFLGGLFAGLVSAGVGEINDYTLLKEYRMHGPAAAGTSVFVVAVTVAVGTVVHAFSLFSNPMDTGKMLGILLFTLPGVILGAQVGVYWTDVIPEAYRDNAISVLFVVLSAATVLSL